MLRKKLTEKDYQWAAERLGCEIEAIKAVAEVEARGRGFKRDGQAKILFEGHIFWRRLKVHGINPYDYLKGNENILHRKWTRKYYRGNQHDRLDQAVNGWKVKGNVSDAIKKKFRKAALEAASWGMFQIMGFNYVACGFSSVQGFINTTLKSEGGQLKCFVNFILSNNLDDEIRDKRWADFARKYNGPGYRANRYDTKMAVAYKRLKKQSARRA